MKLIIFLVLCLYPLKLEVDVSNHSQSSDKFDKYIRVEKDVTRVAQNLKPYGLLLKQDRVSEFGFFNSNIPVIRQAPSLSWKYNEVPLQHDLRKERQYAILPTGISLQGSKERLSMIPVLMRAGRKEKKS